MNTDIQTLADAGAQFVLCREKVAVEGKWQKKKPTVGNVQKWIKKGGKQKIGIMPASLGLIVIDIDKPKTKGEPLPAEEEKAIVEKFGSPLANVETPSGGRHLFYKSAEDFVGNAKWRSGDIRHSSGYVILYEIETVARSLEEIETAPALLAGDFLEAFGRAKAQSDVPNGEARNDEGNWTPGQRNDTLFHKAMVAGVTDDAAEFDATKKKALDAGLSEIEIKNTANNGWQAGQAARNRGVMQARDQNNFLAISRAMGRRFRYNERSAKEEICAAIFIVRDGRRGIIDWTDWEEISDLWRAKLACDIEKHYRVIQGKGSVPFRASNSDYARWILATVFDVQVDPFYDWLMELPEWDGTERLDTLLIDLFAAKDDKFTRWAGRYLPLAAIQRLYDPGCKLDEMPVLYGAQGVGKSAFPLALLGNGEFFRDSLNLSGSDKEQVEAMIGGVIIEIAELTGIRRAHTDHLKAFLSRQADYVRLAYRYDPIRIPRRCVFFGTTDRDDVLPNDPAGNRRFVVIECPGVKPEGRRVEAFMDEHRDQIWAEALHLSNTEDARANLPWDWKEEQERRNKEYRSGDEYLEGMVERLPVPDLVLGFTLEEIYKILDVPPTVSMRSFGSAMKVLGWKKVVRRVGGSKAKRWYPPAGWEPREAAI